MDLYFQEHDVQPHASSSAPPPAESFTRAVRMIFNIAAQTVDYPASTREQLVAEIRARLSHASEEFPIQSKPPASAEVIQTLPLVPPPENTTCSICTEEFEPTDQVRRLPCNHIYHSECIVPWLSAHCTCPMCRVELPTDDMAYEQEKKRRKRQAAVKEMQTFMYN